MMTGLPQAAQSGRRYLETYALIVFIVRERGKRMKLINLITLDPMGNKKIISLNKKDIVISKPMLCWRVQFVLLTRFELMSN